MRETLKLSGDVYLGLGSRSGKKPRNYNYSFRIISYSQCLISTVVPNSRPPLEILPELTSEPQLLGHM